jgi:hypothetical protein
LALVGFYYRLYALWTNHSLWSDEAHVAIFVRSILVRGRPILANGYSLGTYQYLQVWLSAASSFIFGFSEFSLRLPSVFFGALTIWAIYLLGKEFFDQKTALIATFFTTFLKAEIMMSRQLRPYQALQFFSLLAAFFLLRLLKGKKFLWQPFSGFLVSGLLASLMHGLGLVILLNGFLLLLLFRFGSLKKWFWPGALFFLFTAWSLQSQIFLVLKSIKTTNNLFYYRVFLTRNYLPLCFLALLGWLVLFFKKRKAWLILTVFLLSQLFIASFILSQPFTRYFYPAFGFFILLAAFGLVSSSKLVKYARLPAFFVLLFASLFLTRDKITFLPQKVYSLNEDMSETPEVDWKKVYRFVGQKLASYPSTALVTNWNDLPVYFLGEDHKALFLARKNDGTCCPINPLSGAKMIFTLAEFEKMLHGAEQGIAVFDSWDDRIPEGIREYCQENLKKELEVDHLYEVQPRPWPVKVYSWGI